MSGDFSYNHVKCPKCGHDQNPSTASKCEICGNQLKKATVPPIAYLGAMILLGGALLGGGYIALKDKFTNSNSTNPTNTSTNTSTTQFTPDPTTNSSLADAGQYISFGDRLLFTTTSNPDKQAAATAYANGDFPTAISKLETSLKTNPNDPEALVFLNNARLGKKDAIQLAVVLPISKSVNPSLELLRGVAQAQDEANKSGNLIKVAIADDNNDPDRAQQIANTLAKNNDILAVVGHGTSKSSLAAAPIYSQNQLVMIAPTSTTSELTQVPTGGDGTNYIYRTIISDQFTGTALARYMLTGIKKRNAVVFYNSGSSYSKSLRAAFSTTLGLEGGKVVSEVDLSKENPESQLANLKADTLVLLPDSDTMSQAISVIKANKNRIPLLAGDAVYRIENLKEAGRELNGTIISTPWHPLASPNKTFPQAATKLWNANVNWRTALSYDAIQVLKVAIAIAEITPKSGQQGRVGLAKALVKSGFEANGATGKIQFLPSGDRNSNVLLLQVKPGNSSGTGFDFVPIR